MRTIDIFMNVCENVLSYEKCFNNMSNRNKIQWYNLVCSLVEESNFYDNREIGDIFDRLNDIYIEKGDDIRKIMIEELRVKNYFEN